jgi:tyrosine-protein kinase Etk/Wzc
MSSPNSHKSSVAFTFIDLLHVFARRKGLTIWGPLVVAASVALISLLIPNSYTAVARILPPKQSQSAASVLIGQLGLLSNPIGNLTVKNPNELFLGMLMSRSIADNLIARFKLQEVYDEDTRYETRKTLAGRTSITAGREGIITIEVTDRDPQRAAAIANAYVEELENLSQTLAVSEASQRRVFFEKQLQLTKEKLAEAEIKMRSAQERSGLIMLSEQARAIIEAVSHARAQVAAKEIELTSMGSFATHSNPEYRRRQEELSALKAQLRSLESKDVIRKGDVLVPTSRVPEAGLEHVRHLREVKYQEAIFEILAKHYEIARADEAKDSALIQFLDRADVPEKKSGPKRALIVLLTFCLSAVICAVLALGIESTKRLRRNNGNATP